MALDETYRPLLAYWIRQQKDVERDLTRHKDDVQRWHRRAKLASEKSEEELAILAKEQFLIAREAYQKAEARLFVIQHERELVRQAARVSSTLFREATQRANHIMGEFSKLGIDGEFALLEQEMAPLSAAGPVTPGPMKPVGAAFDQAAMFERLSARMEADLRNGDPNLVDATEQTVLEKTPVIGSANDEAWSLAEADRILLDASLPDRTTPVTPMRSIPQPE